MWKLLRVWDYFVIVSDLTSLTFFIQYGWKAIFKTSLMILLEFEESLLDMTFEIMLSQIQHLPHRFLIMENPKKFETEL